MTRKVRHAVHWDPESRQATVYDPDGDPRATGIRSAAEAWVVARALEAFDAEQIPPHGLDALPGAPEGASTGWDAGDVTGAPV